MQGQQQDVYFGAAGAVCSNSSCCWCRSCGSVMRIFQQKFSAALRGFSNLKTWISTTGFKVVPNRRMNHWFRLSRSLARTMQTEQPLQRSYDLKMGRRRRIDAATIVVTGCAAGWLWLGSAGVALLGLWAWSRWPRWATQTITVNYSQLRYARLGSERVFWVERRFLARQVFSDELPGRRYAELRREIKSMFAGGRS